MFAILLSLLSSLLACGQQNPTAPPATATVQQISGAEALESQYGIQITLVGVTALGGMVDFRYKVLDTEKAMQLWQDEALMPVLIDEGSGTEIKTTNVADRPEHMEAGRIYYILYYNTQAAIQSGDSVTVVIGDLRVEHIIAQ